MKIRPIKIGDLAEISKIYCQEMGDNFRQVGEEPIIADDYHKILKTNFKNSRMFVLDDGKILGFLWYEKDGDEINLEEIFITDKRKGYGLMLMNHLLKEAKKERVRKINLNVHWGNKRAIGFFKKLGFSERTIEFSLDLK